MNIELIVVAILFVLLLPNAYSAWFTPAEYRKKMRSGRARVSKAAVWHPETIFYGDMERHPNLEINLARAGYTFGLVVLLVIMVVAVRGPF